MARAAPAASRRGASLLAPLFVGAPLLVAAAVAAAVVFGQAPLVASPLLLLVGLAAAGWAFGARAGLAGLVLAGAGLVALPSSPGAVVIVVDCLSAARFDAEHMPGTWAWFDGRRYAHGLAQSSWTRSAVGSLLTGHWPRDHGLYTLKPPDHLADVPTVAELLGPGVATALFADQAQLDPAFGLAAGFDRYGHRDGRAAGVFDKAQRWRRFFRLTPSLTWVHVLDAHAPYEPVAAVPGPPLPADWRAFVRAVNFEGRVLTASEAAHLEALHAQELRELDTVLTAFLATLDEPTLVILTADHGEAFGEHGWLTHGSWPHAELVEIPFAMRGPGVYPYEGHPRQVDVVPTLLGFFGRPAAALPGVDLRGVLPPDLSYAEYAGEGEHLLAVRSGGWSYLRGRGEERLYDLRVDPTERHPVVSDTAVTQLRALADDYGAGAPGRAVEPPSDTTEALRGMGYVE